MTKTDLPLRAQINITQVWSFLLDPTLAAQSTILLFLIFWGMAGTLFTDERVDRLAKLFCREQKSNIAEAAFVYFANELTKGRILR